MVKTLWPLTGAVCVDGRRLTQVTERGDGGDGAHTRDGGHGGGDALATADAAVCVDGRRLTEVTDKEVTKAAETMAGSEMIVSGRRPTELAHRSAGGGGVLAAARGGGGGDGS